MFHDALEVLKHWWLHITGGLSFTAVMFFVFKDWLLDRTKDIFSWFVSEWERYADKFWNRRKKTRKKEESNVGALQQHVKDLMSWKKDTTRRLMKTEKALVECQAERTECRADYRNMMFRVQSLEKKILGRNAKG